MKKILPILLTVFFLAAISIYLYLKLVSVSFSVQNDIPGYNFGVSSLSGNLFLYTQKYNTRLGNKDFKNIKVVFTTETQNDVRLMLDEGDVPTSSMGVSSANNILVIKEQYSQNALRNIMNATKIQGHEINPDQDLYMYLCMIFDPAKPGRDICYQKAGRYIQELKNFYPIKFVNTTKKISLRLVGKVSAGCSGTIPCGGTVSGYFCSDGKTKCTGAGTQCQNANNTFGICLYRSTCDLSLNNLNCSSISSESLCRNAGIDECYVACNNSAENFCTWSNPTCSQCGTYPNCYNSYCDSNKCAYGCSSNTCDGGVCNPPPPTPTPPPSYTCTVQGYKMVMPGNQNIAPASSQTVTLNDPATSTSTQPYFLSYQSASKTRTVSVSVPANYTVGYTLCYNRTDCHSNAPVMSNTVSLPDNSFCGSSSGYADLWWHYYPPPAPNCKNLTGPASLYVGQTGTFSAAYEDAAGPVTMEGLAIYSENLCEPNTPAYWNRITEAAGTKSFNWVPSAPGTYDVDCRAWNDGIAECRGRCVTGAPIYTCAGPTTTMKVNVLAQVLAWWQVKDSDILANGDIRSSVPSGLYFDLAGSGGYPGVPVYSNTTNLTSSNVSTTKWMANTSYVGSKVYGSNYFINLIPSAATINNVTSTSIPGSFFESGGSAYNGYYWYVYDGAANGNVDLTITSAASLGSRKVILIVKNASLNIQGNINLTKGSGFFLGIVSGNISVASGVGGGSVPNLEGIYIADSIFSTGTGGADSDSQLWVRGTVAGYGGISLQRNLGNATNETTPAELFEYAPDQELLFPIEFSTRVTNWREVAP